MAAWMVEPSRNRPMWATIRLGISLVREATPRSAPWMVVWKYLSGDIREMEPGSNVAPDLSIEVLQMCCYDVAQGILGNRYVRKISVLSS